ncbi:bifunctional lysylphosphatidylglycerol flippase/synthetase MprF [Microbacterium sp. 1P10AE]|uniref:bifunctional lysylphosphatidylglycerol flippase/synthetase MprF n=1 Tax=Microbacterium sp. 1P10AE TaxID=3132286 RepID=UPI00399F7DA2
MPRASIALAAAILVVSLVQLRGSVFVGDGPFDVRELARSVFTVEQPLLLPVVLLAVLLTGGLAERVMGARRVLVAFLGGGLATSVAGLAIGAVESAFLPGLPLNSEVFTGAPPIAALLVVAMTASGFVGALWRRRVRWASTALALTLFLYSASASDLYTLIALPIGLGLGVLSGGRPVTLRVQRSSHHETRVLLAALTAVTAIGPMVATLWGSGAGLLSVYGWLSYDPLTVVDGQVCVAGSTLLACPADGWSFGPLQPLAGWIAALPLIVLLVASWGILRGRRGALGIAIAVNLLVFAGMAYVFAVTEPDTLATLALSRDADATSAVWQILVGVAVGASVPLAVAVTLFVFRRAARIGSAPGARSLFLGTVGLAGVGSIVTAFAGTMAFSRHFSPEPGLEAILHATALRLLPPSLLPSEAIAFVPTTGWAQALWYLPSAVFWTVCAFASVRFVLSPGSTANSGDRARARAVLERGGGGTLSFMTTWTGNGYWFAPDVDAAIAYRVRGRIAVTLGGAFGRDRSDPSVAPAFVDFCGERGWTAVFYSVDGSESAALDALGWSRTQVAEEARLDPATWTPAGKKRQDVRTATHRAAREGVRAEWTTWADLSFRDRTQIREISESWVADKTIPEMEFTLGGVEQMADPAVRLMVARDAQERVVAVTSWLPVRAASRVQGYALDVMRRRHDAMNGVMEFVIGAVVERLRADGFSILSLSGSPLAFHRDGPDAERDPVERFLRQLSALLEPAYGFRSLANFKKKFQPEFTPMWMVYPDPAQLPSIGLALMRCYAPGLTVARAARIAAGLRASARTTKTSVR